MANDGPRTRQYRRAQFVTSLPVDCLYSRAHGWVHREENGAWRVGLTKFATRMLGEMVDHGFEVEPGQAVQLGEVLGWIEGFKAISDLFCMVTGELTAINPMLREQITIVNKDPHGEGWLYEVRGEPDPACMHVDNYCELLDRTIDRLALNQQRPESH